MSIWKTIENVGSAVLQAVLPGTGALIVNAVNALLPVDEKLPVDATGDDVTKAISKLTPDQTALLQKEIDARISLITESNSTLRTMLESDAKNPHSTRPKIALGAFRVVSLVSLVIVGMWAYAVAIGNKEMVTAVTNGWPLAIAIIGPFVGWLNNYFGTLKQEKRDRLNAVNGIAAGGVVSNLINRFNKK